MKASPFPDFMLLGHRGARGVMPENTIEGMLKAIEDGANTLEMDLQFTLDDTVVVAHDPFLNKKYTLDKNGKELDFIPIIRALNYEQVKTYDVGSKFHPDFPRQQKLKIHIPTLNELIEAVEKYVNQKSLSPVWYNIEIKSSPETDHQFHPEPQALVAQVMKVLMEQGVSHRSILQSFDVRQIQEVHRSYPDIPVAYLTTEAGLSLETHLEILGFIPKIFSPHYKIATPQLVDEVHAQGMMFIPWTVNKKADMISFLSMNVDGITTDYPGKLFKLRRNLGT